jgi:hypothetical protein
VSQKGSHRLTEVSVGKLAHLYEEGLRSRPQRATKGKSGARKIRRGRILLLSEERYIETEQRKNRESRTSYKTFAKLPGI